MKISIVIPVYNEAESLGLCLAAISAQTVVPYEVIVVDNNSSDETRQVAAQFSFVSLIEEPRQGVVYARQTGFDAASGTIIARIDADTVLPPEWIDQVQAIMRNTSVTAVSGAPHYYDFALPAVADRIDHYWRKYLADNLGENVFLHGANMAFRRSAWLKVRSRLCLTAGIHEDFDLAIHLQEMGYSVIYDATLIASISSRRIDTKLADYIKYTLVIPKTYALHNLSSRRYMYPVVGVCWLTYLPGRLLYKSYDHESGNLMVSRLISDSNMRVDPTVHVV
jgi:glycosyltransferase involved in cell wall biosynthesis